MGTFEKGFPGGLAGKSAQPSVLPGKTSAFYAAGHPEKDVASLPKHSWFSKRSLL